MKGKKRYKGIFYNEVEDYNSGTLYLFTDIEIKKARQRYDKWLKEQPWMD